MPASFLFRAATLGILMLIATATFVAPAHAQSVSLDCGADQPVCAAFINPPDRARISQNLQLLVAFKYNTGEYADGLTIAIDPPAHFLASAVGAAAPWAGIYPPLAGQTQPSPCTLENAADWNVLCTIRRPAFTTAENLASPQVFTVTFVPRLWATPANYDATFNLTISGRRITATTDTTVSWTDTTTVRMVGEANPYVAAGGGGSPHTSVLSTANNHPDLGRRQGIPAVAFTNNFPVVRIPNPAWFEGASVQRYFEGIRFVFSAYLENRIPNASTANSTPGVTPLDGAMYDPALSDPQHFDQTLDRATTYPFTPGSVALDNFTYRVRFPSWTRYIGPSALGVVNLFSDALRPTWFFTNDPTRPVYNPAVGTLGGANTWIGGTLQRPVGASANATTAFAASGATGPSTHNGNGHNVVSFAGIIPCDILPTLDSDPNIAGIQFATNLAVDQLFQIEASATSQWVPFDAAPGTPATTRTHTIDFATYNAVSPAITLPTSCPGPGLGPVNTKNTGTVGATISESPRQWTIAYHPLQNWFDGYGDAAVLDFLPPMTELRMSGTTQSHTASGITEKMSFGDAWFCVLKRPALQSWGTCITGSTCWEYDPNDTSAWFDPLGTSMSTTYQEDANGVWTGDGLGWNSTLRKGCVRATQVCDHPATRGLYPDCPGAVPTAQRPVLAAEITAVLWRTDGDESAHIDGWNWPDPLQQPPLPSSANFGFVVPQALSFQLTTWATRIAPYAESENNMTRTRNHVRFYGAPFPADDLLAPELGDTEIDLNGDDVPELTWPTLLSHPLTIDNTIPLDVRIFQFGFTSENPIGGLVWAYPSAMLYVDSRGYYPDPLGGWRFEYEYPPGFLPTSATPGTDVLAVPMTIGGDPNPVGLSGTLNQGLHLWVGSGSNWMGGTRPTLADIDAATLSWNATTERWTMRVDFAPTWLSIGWNSFSSSNLPMRIPMRVQETPAFPFRAGTLYAARLRVTVDGYDGPDVNDPNDWSLWRSANYQVRVNAGMEIRTEPVCVAGRTAPSFHVLYSNSGGYDLYGARAIFQVPTDVDGEPMVFAAASIDANAYPPGTTPVLEVFTEHDDGFTSDDDPDWLPYWNTTNGYVFSGDPASVRLVRLRFDGAATAANTVPAHWGPGRWRVDLAHPSAGLDDIGGQLGPVSYVGAIPTGAGQLVPISRTVATDFFVLGECPGELVVTKFLDTDGDGVRDGDEPVLAGWSMALSPESSASAGAENGVDTSVRSATTDMNGEVRFALWPGQVPTLTETLPDPRTIPIPDYTPTVATLVWTATTAGGTTQTLAIANFETTTTASFGNRCTCNTDTNLCVDATCIASPEAPDLATCGWQQVGPVCGTATDLCAVGDGRCDPTTGTCVWDETPCGPSVPTRVYVPIADAQGTLVGSAICHIEHGQNGGVEAIRCDTIDENGETVLRLVDVNHCGE